MRSELWRYYLQHLKRPDSVGDESVQPELLQISPQRSNYMHCPSFFPDSVFHCFENTRWEERQGVIIAIIMKDGLINCKTDSGEKMKELKASEQRGSGVFLNGNYYSFSYWCIVFHYSEHIALTV